jgi:hypothetical protein
MDLTLGSERLPLAAEILVPQDLEDVNRSWSPMAHGSMTPQGVKSPRSSIMPRAVLSQWLFKANMFSR